MSMTVSTCAPCSSSDCGSDEHLSCALIGHDATIRARTWGAGRRVGDDRFLERQEIWHEPPVGGLVDASLLTKPWQEILRLIDDGGAPQPPVAHLCGRRLIALEEGRAEVAIPASEWFWGPKGRVDTGMFACLADMAHFYAVLSTLPAMAGCTTAELSMTFLGQPAYGRSGFTASSEVVHADDHNALAVALVRDDQGRAVAHSTSRYFLFPAGTVKRQRAPAPGVAPLYPRFPGERVNRRAARAAPPPPVISPLPDPVLRPCALP